MWSLAHQDFLPELNLRPLSPHSRHERVQTLQPLNTNYTDQALITLIYALTITNAAAPALTLPACDSIQPTHIQYDTPLKS